MFLKFCLKLWKVHDAMATEFHYFSIRDNFKFFGLVSVIFGLPPIVLKAYRTLLRRQFDANCKVIFVC